MGADLGQLWEEWSDRLTTAALNVPDATDWSVCLALFVGYGAIALPVGFRTGLLQWEWVTEKRTILSSLVVALVFPAIFEEGIFRVLLLPHPSEAAPLGAIALWSSISLVLFTVSHPLNALWVLTARRDTFYNGTFLTLAALLGGACTLAYLQSGSLWPPVMLHWGVVIIWLLALGGDRRMSP